MSQFRSERSQSVSGARQTTRRSGTSGSVQTTRAEGGQWRNHKADTLNQSISDLVSLSLAAVSSLGTVASAYTVVFISLGTQRFVSHTHTQNSSSLIIKRFRLPPPPPPPPSLKHPFVSRYLSFFRINFYIVLLTQMNRFLSFRSPQTYQAT